MADGLQLSARSVANLLERIVGPAIYDAPPFGGIDVKYSHLGEHVRGPRPEPWSWVTLNPQPLPPAERRALALADAHIQEVLSLDRLSTLWGGELAGRAEERALRLIAEVDELCPRWPRWPKVWPPPPPPPWDTDMTDTALFVFGARFVAAADLPEQGRLQDALNALGEKALGLSMRG